MFELIIILFIGIFIFLIIKPKKIELTASEKLAYEQRKGQLLAERDFKR